MQEKRILILGIGNTLLGDEGFGVHAVRWLAEHYTWPGNIKLVDGGTLGLMLMAELLECDLAIILDVALGGEEPGTFYRIEGEDLGSGMNVKQSMHQTGIADILVSCELAGDRPAAVAFAMEPYDIQHLQAGLTREAAEKLPQFCERVLLELAAMDIKPET